MKNYKEKIIICQVKYNLINNPLAEVKGDEYNIYNKKREKIVINKLPALPEDSHSLTVQGLKITSFL